MKISDAIPGWHSLSWGGSYSSMNNLHTDPATSKIQSVEVIENNQKSIHISVKKADGNQASAIIMQSQVTAGFDKIAETLKSAVDKTLNEAAEIEIRENA